MTDNYYCLYKKVYMIHFFTHLGTIFTLMHKAMVNLNAARMGKLENNFFCLSRTEGRKQHFSICRNSYILLTRQIADGGYVCVCVWAARLVDEEEVVPLR